MLSIIIPTLNEEKYLPFLLKSIKRQEGKIDYELIVADAGSVDRTVEIAQYFGCRIVAGGLPARGRNAGASVAKGDKLLFLDADLILPQDFLIQSLAEFKARGLKSASYQLVPRTHNFGLKLIFQIFYNWLIVFTEKFLANGAMAILFEKSVFETVGGFDEEIKLGEDVYLLRQAFKIAEFGIIRSVKVSFPLRRYETDGYIATFTKYIFNFFYMFFGRPVKARVFRYKFNHYQD